VAYTPHHLTAKTLASRRALEGVRKQVTGLSSDVIDWSEFINGLDPEAAHMKGKVPWERIWAGGVIVCAL
jgi:hypothetical protein